MFFSCSFSKHGACAYCCFYAIFHKEIPIALLPFSVHHIFCRENVQGEKKKVKMNKLPAFHSKMAKDLLE